jgi:hypothetical protein
MLNLLFFLGGVLSATAGAGAAAGGGDIA